MNASFQLPMLDVIRDTTLFGAVRRVQNSEPHFWRHLVANTTVMIETVLRHFESSQNVLQADTFMQQSLGT